jgi:type IV secretion system protein VirB8
MVYFGKQNYQYIGVRVSRFEGEINMQFGKKSSIVAADDETIHEETRDWEASENERAAKSERRAWRIAGGSFVLSIVCVVAVTVLVLRHKPFAFLVERDKVTGETTTLMTMDRETIDFEEVEDKHNVKRYVEARESYYYSLLQRDYDLTLMMSCDEVGAEYAKQYDDTNPQALDKVLGQGAERRIKVLSVRLPNDEPGKAVVSFERRVKKMGLTELEKPERFVATLSYKYNPSMLVKESVWIENPRGFKVCAYRADPELVSR